MIRVE